MNRTKDFEIARDQGWYRLPEGKAGRGAFFEYVAFYFTAAFGSTTTSSLCAPSRLATS